MSNHHVCTQRVHSDKTIVAEYDAQENAVIRSLPVLHIGRAARVKLIGTAYIKCTTYCMRMRMLLGP